MKVRRFFTNTSVAVFHNCEIPLLVGDELRGAVSVDGIHHIWIVEREVVLLLQFKSLKYVIDFHRGNVVFPEEVFIIPVVYAHPFMNLFVFEYLQEGVFVLSCEEVSPDELHILHVFSQVVKYSVVVHYYLKSGESFIFLDIREEPVYVSVRYDGGGESDRFSEGDNGFHERDIGEKIEQIMFAISISDIDPIESIEPISELIEISAFRYEIRFFHDLPVIVHIVDLAGLIITVFTDEFLMISYIKVHEFFMGISE